MDKASVSRLLCTKQCHEFWPWFIGSSSILFILNWGPKPTNMLQITVMNEYIYISKYDTSSIYDTIQSVNKHQHLIGFNAVFTTVTWWEMTCTTSMFLILTNELHVSSFRNAGVSVQRHVSPHKVEQWQLEPVTCHEHYVHAQSSVHVHVLSQNRNEQKLPNSSPRKTFSSIEIILVK